MKPVEHSSFRSRILRALKPAMEQLMHPPIWIPLGIEASHFPPPIFEDGVEQGPNPHESERERNH